MYQVKRHSTSHFVPLRGHHYHVREWGNPQSSLPPVVLAHGWMDVAASWQFMVDSFSEAFFQSRRILAADWRGYGLTTRTRHRQLLAARLSGRFGRPAHSTVP
jgi:pimeloyl-ACP methyl ester carboxylesterase